MNFDAENQAGQPAPLSGDEPQEILIPKKYVFGALGGIILLVLIVFSGVHTRGYESKTVRFAKIAKSSSGHSLGSKRVFLRQGQTFTVDYDVEIDHGRLYLRLRDFWSLPNEPAIREVRVSQSGTGQFEVPIPKTGVYQLWISGLPDKNGYALSYTVSWKGT